MVIDRLSVEHLGLRMEDVEGYLADDRGIRLGAISQNRGTVSSFQYRLKDVLPPYLSAAAVVAALAPHPPAVVPLVLSDNGCTRRR